MPRVSVSLYSFDANLRFSTPTSEGNFLFEDTSCELKVLALTLPLAPWPLLLFCEGKRQEPQPLYLSASRRAVVKGRVSGNFLPGCVTLGKHSIWPCLSFSVCQIEIIIAPTSEDCCKDLLNSMKMASVRHVVSTQSFFAIFRVILSLLLVSRAYPGICTLMLALM